MQRLWVVSDTPTRAAAIRRQLDGMIFDLYFLDVDHIRDIEPPPYLLFDFDFRNSSLLVKVKEWLKGKPKGGRALFAIDQASHLHVVQAKALGATGILHRSLERKELVKTLLDDLDSVSNDSQDDPIKTSPGVGKACDALGNIFTSAWVGARLDPVAINSAGDAVMRRMEVDGLASWINTVRNHHSQTYQHCLIVTGVTVAFAQHLGLSRSDQQRLSFGAMLHDVGKAMIPLSILEKPAALTADEMAVVSKHPEYGLEALKTSPGLTKEVLDIVIHHHEYLDGSGYPHGLSGGEISDPIRIMTICDVFGALVERRAYKAPLAADVAYQILRDMGNKLDKDLVREFGFTKALPLNTGA